jgi:DNA polymerase III delta prime subunit
MFDFLKKSKPKDLHIIPEPQQDLKLSVRERALNVFSEIEGLDDIKEMMLRALESPERAHTLLVGPPACAKSLFMLEIEKGMQYEVYFTEGAATIHNHWFDESPRLIFLHAQKQDNLDNILREVRGALQQTNCGCV